MVGIHEGKALTLCAIGPNKTTVGIHVGAWPNKTTPMIMKMVFFPPIF